MLALFESGGRSQPGASSRSRTLAAAIPRCEFGLRDPGRVSSSNGACRDGRWSRKVLLGAGATGLKRRPMSRRAEPAAGFGEGQRRLAPDAQAEACALHPDENRSACFTLV